MEDNLEKIQFKPKWNPYPETKPDVADEYFITYIDAYGVRRTTRRSYDFGNLGPWRNAYGNFSQKVIAWAEIPKFEFDPYDGYSDRVKTFHSSAPRSYQENAECLQVVRCTCPEHVIKNANPTFNYFDYWSEEDKKFWLGGYVGIINDGFAFLCNDSKQLRDIAKAIADAADWIEKEEK